LTEQELLDRARSQLGRGTVYRYGGGKIIPEGTDCRDELGGCDCSAFACWVFRMRKWQADELYWLKELNDGWYSTDGIWMDAMGNDSGSFGPAYTGNFFRCRLPIVGCAVVYPSAAVSKKKGPRIGHVGIITKVRSRNDYSIIHCSSSNFKRTGDAIQETSGRLFERVSSSIFAWPASMRP
jgi:hypothetical protein